MKDEKIVKKLICGHARSGTKYTSHFCTALGLNMPHEVKIGKHGIVSWRHIVHGRVGYEFGAILHQVRDPLKVIASSHRLMVTSWKYMAKHIDIKCNEHILIRCVKSYLMWNKLIEEKAMYRYKVEELITPKVFKEWCYWMDILVPDDIPKIDETMNTRPHKMLTWGDITQQVPIKLVRKLELRIKKYGYEI